MRMTNLKIGARLSVGFGFLVALLVAMALLGVSRLSALNEQMDEVVNDKYPKTVLANEIIKNVNIIARSSRNVLLMTDSDEISKEMQTIRKSSENTKTALEKLDALVTGDKGRALIQSILDARTQYNVGRDEVLHLVEAGAKNEATLLLLQKVRPIQLTYMTAIEALITHQDQLMQSAGQEVADEYQEARMLVIALSGI